MTAMIAAAAIGVGGSYLMSRKANKAAKKAGDQAADSDAAQLAFAQQQYDDWQATYGPIEDQLAKYYETLTPSFRITQGLEAHEKEMDRMRTNVRETLDQRGIGTSGIAGQAELEMGVSSAEERARIRAAAPMEVAREKLGFLNTGLGQNPNSSMDNALAAQSARYGQNEQIAGRNAGVATNALINSGTNLVQAGFNAWMNRPTTTSGANTYTGPSGPPV